MFGAHGCGDRDLGPEVRVRRVARRLARQSGQKETDVKATIHARPQRPAAIRTALRDTSGGGRAAAHEPRALTGSRSCPGPLP